MKIAELFARIGVKTDEGKVKGFGKTLGNVRLGMVAAAGAALALTNRLMAISQEAMDAARQLKQFEAETGASATALQRWQQVAQQTNNSASAVAQSIRAIADNQAAIRLGQGNISGFQLLGIDPHQDPFEILEELRTKTAGLTQSMKKNVLQQVGVSADLIQVLELTNDQFDLMAGRAFVMDPAAVQTLDAARAATQSLGQAFTWLKQNIATALAPAMTEMTMKLTEWIRANKDGIVESIQRAATWLNRFVTMVSRGALMIDQIVKNTIGWDSAIKGLIAVIAILNMHLLMSPIGAFVAGIILLLGVLEDLYVYEQGGKSLFGYLMETFPKFAAIMNPVIDAFRAFSTAIGLLFAGDMSGLKALTEEWGILGSIVWGVVDAVTKVFDLMHGDDVSDRTADLAAGAGIGGISSDVVPMYDFNNKDGPQNAREWVQEELRKYRNDVEASGFLRATFVPGFLRRDQGGGSSTTNNIDINIQGASNPEETARRTATELERSLKAADAQRARDE